MYRPFYVALIGGYAALIGGIILACVLLGSDALPVAVVVLMALYGATLSAAAVWCERAHTGRP
jgi:hypothetical protein